VAIDVDGLQVTLVVGATGRLADNVVDMCGGVNATFAKTGLA